MESGNVVSDEEIEDREKDYDHESQHDTELTDINTNLRLGRRSSGVSHASPTSLSMCDRHRQIRQKRNQYTIFSDMAITQRAGSQIRTLTCALRQPEPVYTPI